MIDVASILSIVALLGMLLWSLASYEHMRKLAEERGETINRLMEALARKEGVPLDLRKPEPTSAAEAIKQLTTRKTPPPYFKSKPSEPIETA